MCRCRSYGAISKQALRENQDSLTVELKKGHFTADQYVTDDDPKIFNWVIHPEGFQSPKIMELAKLQAWTLKPAVLRK
jgi:hypothetical protein